MYLQREDHVETKRVSHGKTLKNLTASPGDPLSSAPASVADSTPKPDAEQEVQASDMEISIIISLSLELGCLRNLWMLMMPHNRLFDRNRLFWWAKLWKLFFPKVPSFEKFKWFWQKSKRIKGEALTGKIAMYNQHVKIYFPILPNLLVQFGGWRYPNHYGDGCPLWFDRCLTGTVPEHQEPFGPALGLQRLFIFVHDSKH